MHEMSLNRESLISPSHADSPWLDSLSEEPSYSSVFAIFCFFSDVSLNELKLLDLALLPYTFVGFDIGVEPSSEIRGGTLWSCL